MGLAEVETGAGVDDGERQPGIGGLQLQCRGALGGVLGAILQRFEATEVRRGFGTGRKARRRHVRIRLQRNPRRPLPPPNDRLERRCQPSVGQHRREDPARQLAHGVECFGRLHADLLQQILRLRRVCPHQLLGNAHRDGNRHELLLCAIVNIALQAPPLGVLGSHDALARCAQLQVEPHVLERRAGLRGKVHQELLLGSGDGLTR